MAGLSNGVNDLLIRIHIRYLETKFSSNGHGNDARIVIRLGPSVQAVTVVEARIEARLSILDVRASFFEPPASILASSPVNDISFKRNGLRNPISKTIFID
jgi:hypothetical protein